MLADNGVGFNKVDRDKMQTPYFTTKKSGTGLGLAVVSKVLNDHNASITFNMNKDKAEVKVTLLKFYG